jgi:phage/plasmid primase-like uncharacterized protein
MNRSQLALLRKGLVAGSAPQDCPACGGRLEFGTDRLGRTTEFCGCGYDALVRKRDVQRDDGSATATRSAR